MRFAKTTILLILLPLCAYASPNVRQPAVTKTISVIIPCVYKHAQYLHSLLQRLEQQTVMPNEVIISLSECHKVEPATLHKIQNEPWKFRCIVLTSEKIQYAGENRNRACSRATGDIFVLQDADDIPHPQRIEVIKYFFEHYHVNHLMHEYVESKSPGEKPQFIPIENLDHLKYGLGRDFNTVVESGKFSYGSIAISRELFDTMKWSETMRREQDEEFNRRVYENHENLFWVKTPLLFYRIFYSSR